MTTQNIKIQLVRKGPASVASNLEEVQTNLTDLNEGEVLVKVEACGVCYRDIIDREGGNSFLSTPIALGHEIAGVVQQSTVSEWKQGDRIVSLHGAPCRECKSCKEGNSPRCVVNAGYFYGLLCDGGYQKYAILHHKSLVPLPGSISFSEGSFLCCTAAVALRALRLASIKPGDKVLITGASGGVGVHAIQVVKGLGAKPICVTSSENKIAALKDLGAELVILSKENSFHREVIQELGGPVDIVLELVGGLTFRSSLASVKPTGTVVVVGNISVANVQIPLGRMILFELKVIGSSGATPEDLEEVIRMAENKVLKPQLWKEFPLSVEGVQAAHSLLKHKGVMGRVVLKSSL